jgi:hypothetical protein
MPRPRRPRWRGIAIAAALAFVVAVVNVITLSRDAAVLRRAVVRAGDLDLSTKVQISTGPVLLGLARGVTRLVDQVPPEVRQALASVRRASVGVYDLERNATESDRSRILADADLRGRGWTRLVAVRNPDSTVVVYTTDANPSGSSLQVCLAVCNQQQLVIASATVRPDALMDLVKRQIKSASL